MRIGSHRPPYPGALATQLTLADGERSLVTLQASDEHNLHRIDVERGAIVDTWVRRAEGALWAPAHRRTPAGDDSNSPSWTVWRARARAG